jgi:2OG-Fe(II) oxygenase superfamily
MPPSAEDGARYVLAAGVTLRPRSDHQIAVDTAGGRSLLLPVPLAQALLQFAQPIAAEEAAAAAGLYLAPGRALALAHKLAELECLDRLSPEGPARPPTPDSAEDLSQHLSPRAQALLAEHLPRGHVCIIRDAVDPELAAQVHDELTASDRWRPYEEFHRHFAFRHHNLYEQSQFPPALMRSWRIFSAPQTRRWISDVSGRPCLAPPQFGASLYLPGDHSLPHDDSDSERRRQIAFVWHLTREWDIRWGGDFFWCSPPTAVCPSFNSLIVFAIQPRQSYHFVSMVSPLATGRRLTVNGWWLAEQSSVPAGSRPPLGTVQSVEPGFDIVAASGEWP